MVMSAVLLLCPCVLRTASGRREGRAGRPCSVRDTLCLLPRFDTERREVYYGTVLPPFSVLRAVCTVCTCVLYVVPEVRVALPHGHAQRLSCSTQPSVCSVLCYASCVYAPNVPHRTARNPPHSHAAQCIMTGSCQQPALCNGSCSKWCACMIQKSAPAVFGEYATPSELS